MIQQYEYEFERVRAIKGFLGSYSNEYQEVIRRRAESGWRFVQAYAPPLGLYGTTSIIDLIFERPRQP